MRWGDWAEGAKLTTHVYGGGAACLAEYDSTESEGETCERWFVHGPGFPDPLVLVDLTREGDRKVGEEEYLYYLKDLLGSVTALANSNGTVVERYVYDPYGGTIVTEPSGDNVPHQAQLWPEPSPGNPSDYGNPFMWTGQRYNDEVGLYHFLFRSYSPEFGRWLQRDPLGYVDGANLYEYVMSSPLTLIDPLGLFFWFSSQKVAGQGGVR